MLPLTPQDLTILCAMHGHRAPTRPQIEAIVSDQCNITLPEFKRRLYRLSRHGLCVNNPPCWRLSVAGNVIVNAVDGTDWDRTGFVYEYRKESRT